MFIKLDSGEHINSEYIVRIGTGAKEDQHHVIAQMIDGTMHSLYSNPTEAKATSQLNRIIEEHNTHKTEITGGSLKITR